MRAENNPEINQRASPDVNILNRFDKLQTPDKAAQAISRTERIKKRNLGNHNLGLLLGWKNQERAASADNYSDPWQSTVWRSDEVVVCVNQLRLSGGKR
jgi:hypothetical protein